MRFGEDTFEELFGTQSRPPDPRERLFPIISATPGQETSVLLTSDALICLETHYLAGESKPHLQSGRCPWCDRKSARRWKGYGCAIEPYTGRSQIVEVTSNAAHVCPALIDMEKSLRGQLLILWRRGGSKNAPVMARLEKPNATLSKYRLPPPFDLRSALLKIWRVTPDEFGGLVEPIGA